MKAILIIGVYILIGALYAIVGAYSSSQDDNLSTIEEFFSKVCKEEVHIDKKDIWMWTSAVFSTILWPINLIGDVVFNVWIFVLKHRK